MAFFYTLNSVKLKVQPYLFGKPEMERLLLDIDDVKAHLQVDHDFDDDLIFSYMEGAQKLFENYVERPLFSDVEMTQKFHGGHIKLILEYFPVDPESVTVQDTVRDEELKDGDFEVDNLKGFLYKVSGLNNTPVRWGKGINRWEVTYKPGIIHSPMWDRYKEEALAASFRDLVSDFYEHRTPGTRETRLGGGSVIAAVIEEVSPRIRGVWNTIGRDLSI